jgi:hypothetical protein
VPLPRWLTVVAVAAIGVLLAGLFSAPAAVAAPAPGLCPTDTSRGLVPSSFAIDACLDASSVWLHNTLKVPITIKETGDTGTPVTVSPDQTVASVATRAHYNNPNLLLPGDLIRVPLGPGEAAVELASTDAGGFYILAFTLGSFLPGGKPKAVYDAFTGMVADMSEAILARNNCRARKSWIEQSACDVTLVGWLTKALAVGSITGLATGATAVIFSVKLWADVVAAQVPDVRTIIAGDRVVRARGRSQPASQQPAGPNPSGQASGTPSAGQPSPTPTKPVVALTDTSVGPVRFGAGESEALRSLTGLLGPPDSDIPGVCELAGPSHGRFLTWQDLTVQTNGHDPQPPALVGWAVKGPRLPQGVTLPSNLVPGSATVTQVLAAGGVLSRGVLGDWYTLGPLGWHVPDGKSTVDEAAANPPLCE